MKNNLETQEEVRRPSNGLQIKQLKPVTSKLNCSSPQIFREPTVLTGETNEYMDEEL